MGKRCGINEALEILRDSLKSYGLDEVDVTIYSHGHTPAESDHIAAAIVGGGFGEGVKPAVKPNKREFDGGWFSWNEVEQSSDRIYLFFDLDKDDQPIDYLPTGMEEKQC